MLLVIRSTLIMAVFAAVVSAAGSARCAPSDPFANQTIDVVSGSLLEKWLATNKELARDHALLSACSDSEVFGCEAALQLRNIIEDAKAQKGLAVIGHINRAINFAIKPARHGDWLAPLDAINKDGDCKAYSIAKYFALREAGIAPDHLRLVVVHANHSPSGDHMVVATLWQDQWLILDNLTLALVPDALSEYVPLLVLDDSGMRGYVVKTPAFNN
jgi:predicted transglutaminase-like cysteine proteinase